MKKNIYAGSAAGSLQRFQERRNLLTVLNAQAMRSKSLSMLPSEARLSVTDRAAHLILRIRTPILEAVRESRKEHVGILVVIGGDPIPGKAHRPAWGKAGRGQGGRPSRADPLLRATVSYTSVFIYLHAPRGHALHAPRGHAPRGLCLVPRLFLQAFHATLLAILCLCPNVVRVPILPNYF